VFGAFVASASPSAGPVPSPQCVTEFCRLTARMALFLLPLYLGGGIAPTLHVRLVVVSVSRLRRAGCETGRREDDLGIGIWDCGFLRRRGTTRCSGRRPSPAHRSLRAQAAKVNAGLQRHTCNLPSPHAPLLPCSRPPSAVRRPRSAVRGLLSTFTLFPLPSHRADGRTP